MDVLQIILHGIIKPDGTLEVLQPVNLPPGEVRITVQALENVPRSRDDVWAVLDKIWAAQETRGYLPRTREQIDENINALRDEADEDFKAIERIHLECEQDRQATGGPRERSS